MVIMLNLRNFKAIIAFDTINMKSVRFTFALYPLEKNMNLSSRAAYAF